ncbi:MAG: hypothetical protein ACREAC_15555, partial [Blastocatellia bacterium]
QPPLLSKRRFFFAEWLSVEGIQSVQSETGRPFDAFVGARRTGGASYIPNRDAQPGNKLLADGEQAF